MLFEKKVIGYKDLPQLSIQDSTHVFVPPVKHYLYGVHQNQL